MKYDKEISTNMKKYYDILGIGVNSTEEDIKKARRRLCSVYHPDQGGDSEKFNVINKAYEEIMKNRKSGIRVDVSISSKTKKCVRHKNLFDLY